VTLPIDVKTAFEQADCYLFENTATGREISISQEKLKSEWVKKATENQTGLARDYYIKRALEYKKASILKQSGNLEYYEEDLEVERDIKMATVRMKNFLRLPLPSHQKELDRQRFFYPLNSTFVYFLLRRHLLE
jgi:hypothetical protein